MDNLARLIGGCGLFVLVLLGSLMLLPATRSSSAAVQPPQSPVPGSTYLLVTSFSSNAVLRYDGVTGNFVDAFVPPGSGGLVQPNGLRYGPDGNLYVSSCGVLTDNELT